jgi:sarcosine oxidase subunit beta
MSNIADIIIIGGGISGVATAYELAKRGATNTILFEKEYLASGSTGRCGAGVRMQWGTKTNCLLSKYAIERYETLAQELDYSRGIDFCQNGYLMCAATEKELEQFKKNVALQNSLGIPSRIITPEEAKEIIPYINTDYMLGGTFCGKDGFLNPFHTVEAYAQAAMRLGVNIKKYTAVDEILTNNDKVIGVKCGDDVYYAEKVLLATNGYTASLTDKLGLKLPFYSQRHQILVTEPVPPLQKPMFMGFVHNIYCQQSPEGSFIMGRGDADEPTDLRVTSGWRFLSDMTKNLVKLLPILKDLNIVRQWAGLYHMSPDKQPVYDEIPEYKGLYIAAGYSGHGFMFGPVTGVVMAEMMLGLMPTVDVSEMKLERFSSGRLLIEPSVV